ncbi:MAG: L-threonylcarbamoyladenylate synthase [Actinomycetes bacterium]
MISIDPVVAATALGAGDLAALPTETVYGLGGLASSESAIARIFEVKGRPRTHPVIVHVEGPQDLQHWACEVPASALALAQEFWPGPLTLVLASADNVPGAITGGQPTVAIRAPAHPLFREVLRLLNDDTSAPVGIAAPSANRFGHVSPTTASDVEHELGDRLRPGRDVILDGGRCVVGVESTIVIWTERGWRIAREGGITREQLGRTVELRDDSPTAIRVPGTIASHYSPRARVLVPESLSEIDVDQVPGPVGLLALADVPDPMGWVRLAAPVSTEEYARALFSALRRADELALATVVAIPPTSAGLGAAIRDRLDRAAF